MRENGLGITWHRKSSSVAGQKSGHAAPNVTSEAIGSYKCPTNDLLSGVNSSTSRKCLTRKECR